MLKVTGLMLKKEGKIILKQGNLLFIKWIDKTKQKRMFFYCVTLQGKKFTLPYRLKKHEADYWRRKHG